MARTDDTTDGDSSEVVLLPNEGNEPETPEVVSEQEDPIKRLEAEAAELRAQLAAERARSAAAEAQASDSQGRLVNEVSTRVQAQAATVEANIVSAQTALTMAKAAYVKASEEGRFADAGELAEQISDARTKLNAANWEKSQLEAAKERAKTAPPQPTGTPEERYLATISSTEAKRWLNSHRDVLTKMVSDNRFQARVIAADALAFSELGERDTPEYFEFIEGELGIKETSRGKGTTTAAPANNRRATASHNTSSGEREVKLSEVIKRLTPSMRAAAKTSFPNMKENEALETYAMGLVKSKARDSSYLPDFKLW